MLRLTTLGATAVLAGVLAGPVSAQEVDCANLPEMATAEPAEFAHCAPPVVVVNHGNSGGLPAWAVNLRASAPTGRGFITFQYDNAPAAALIGADEAAFYAGDFAGNDFTQMYAVDSGTAPGDPTLYSIDATAGVKTAIGPTGLASGSNVGAMAWDYTTETMFALSGLNLYTVNLSTGAMTLVGAITGGMATPINLLAHPQDGKLYSVELTTDELFSIDKSTGAASLIGPIGIAINFAQGADFDNASGVGYMCAYEGAGVNSVRTINLETGATTAVSSFTNSEVDFCSSMNPRSGTAIEPPAANEAHLVAEPNPFSQQTQLLLTVGQEQQVRVEVYDMVGRHVTTLFDQHVAAGQPVVVTLYGRDLHPGVYVARAIGETFVQTQRLTVAR